MKTIFAPHLGRHVKLGGRKRPSPLKPGRRRLKLGDYMTGAAPVAPSSVDYTAKAKAALSQMYDNDTLGCCVIAGYYPVLGVATGNASGTPFIATGDQIVADYSAIGGYKPGDESTDQGCDEETAFQYWETKGSADGSKLAVAIQLDPTNVAQLQLGLFLSENHYYGLELPDPYVTPFPSANGFTWGLAGAPDPNNGHCIMGAGYNSSGVRIITWGLEGLFTYDAIAEYCTEQNGGAVYALLTPDQIAVGQQLAPNGIDWAALRADLAALGTAATAPAN